MTVSKFYLGLVFTLMYSTAIFSAESPVPDFAKTLNGVWVSPAWDGRLIEHWQTISAETFESNAVYIENSDTLYASTSRIEKVGDNWMLFSVIKDGAPKIFQAIEWSEQHILFENKEYTNPRQVRYEFVNDYQFKRTISGTEKGEPTTYTFNFELTPEEERITEDLQPLLQTAFEPLIGKRWRAEGQWENGPVFKQEVAFEWDLEQKVIIALSDGFVDKKQTKWGQRNHGIRYWDQSEDVLRFSEYDVFGGLTEGTITIYGNDIYYQYNYGGTELTEVWEKVDDHTYNYKVGTFANGKWNEEYLNTQFIDITNGDPVMIDTDLSLPYRQIPDYPEKFNACTVAARMLDGLGFRYYWATETLRQQDLDYRVTPESRTSGETLDHIYGLVSLVHKSIMEKPNIRPAVDEELSFTEQRERTLRLIMEASERLKASKSKDMKRFNIIFQRGDQRSEFPFWNNLNGPIADALWHVGQIVALRRASGNPFNSKASVFNGKLRE